MEERMIARSTRHERRAAATLAKRAAKTGAWSAWEDRSHTAEHPLAPKGMTGAYLNNVYSVQIYERPDWQGFRKAMIRRHDGAAVRDWRHLQRIKSELFGAQAVALEMFPAESDLVDEANMYWLWVAPVGFSLPFMN